MSNLIVPGQGIVFMKVGVHAREDLAAIIERKSKEIDEAGFALWGYGGSTCHPTTMVQPFAKDYASRGQTVYLCMQEMKSNHFAEPIRADQYSVDGIIWQDVPAPINVRGSRYALAIKKLRKEELELPATRSQVAIGASMGRLGNQYIQGRVDKACLKIKENADLPLEPGEKVIQINFVAELCDPYAVFMRNRQPL